MTTQPRHVQSLPQKRQIAAPKSTSPTGRKNGGRNKDRIVFPPVGSIDMNSSVDYRNFQFFELDPLENIEFDVYCGPTPESNWVIPDVFLVGAYPASAEDSDTFDLLTSLLKKGVGTFVCLQEEYPDDSIPECEWRNGNSIRPYFEDLKLIIKNKKMFSALSDYDIVDESSLKFIHFPIKDCDVSDDIRVMDLAMKLVTALSAGEVMYLHCWGGHGRTGTVVCIMLFLMYGLDTCEIFERCQFVHDIRKCPVVVGSPQTQVQRDQVVRVIEKFKKMMEEQEHIQMLQQQQQETPTIQRTRTPPSLDASVNTSPNKENEVVIFTPNATKDHEQLISKAQVTTPSQVDEMEGLNTRMYELELPTMGDTPNGDASWKDVFDPTIHLLQQGLQEQSMNAIERSGDNCTLFNPSSSSSSSISHHLLLEDVTNNKSKPNSDILPTITPSEQVSTAARRSSTQHTMLPYTQPEVRQGLINQFISHQNNVQGRNGVIPTDANGASISTKKSRNTSSKYSQNQNQNPNWNPNHHVPGVNIVNRNNNTNNSNGNDNNNTDTLQQSTMLAKPPQQPKAPSSYGGHNEGGVRKFNRVNRLISTSMDQSLQQNRQPKPPSASLGIKSDSVRGSGNVTKSLDIPRCNINGNEDNGSNSTKGRAVRYSGNGVRTSHHRQQEDFTAVGVVTKADKETSHESAKKSNAVSQFMKWVGAGAKR